ALAVRGDERIPHRVRPDDFHRDRHAQLGIPRLIDRPHSADAERPDDVIARPERLPGCEWAAARDRRRAAAQGCSSAAWVDCWIENTRRLLGRDRQGRGVVRLVDLGKRREDAGPYGLIERGPASRATTRRRYLAAATRANH